MRRVAAGALALGLLLAGCTSDDAPSEEAEAAATTTTSTPSQASVRLRQVLVGEDDLPGFRTVVDNRSFSAQRATRINLCGEDLRSELRIVSGRQSRFTDGEVEISHTVTSGGDTNDALARFQEVVDGCEAPWTEPSLPNGGGPVEREITGTYPVPEVGVAGAGAIIRSTNAAGSSDTIVVLLVDGAVVSSVSVSGPLGSDFSVVDTAIQAAADRLLEAQSAATP